jgi:large subunit ribosomal protein L29
MAVGTKASELRELNDEELVVKLREAKEELFRLRFQAATGQLENNSRLKAVRKDIARVYTLMRERELGIETVVVIEEAEEPVEDTEAEETETAEAVEDAR